MEAQAGQGAQKVPLYSINDLKNATDDALVPYLIKLPAPYAFQQSHYLSNVRLAVGYSAVIIAAVTFYFDYTLGWDATKIYTAVACVAYFILNGFLTLWVWKVEGGKVFVGSRASQEKLTLGSSVKKNVPIYKLKVLYESASGQVLEEREIEGRFSQWFNDQGWLQPKELRQWLAKNIEIIGKADPPKNAITADKTSAIETTPVRSGIEISDGTKSTKRGKKRG